jgi:hypothetical protein
MWIPLRPVEEETDPEKAQKLEELIVILRKVSGAERQNAQHRADGTRPSSSTPDDAPTRSASL